MDPSFLFFLALVVIVTIATASDYMRWGRVRKRKIPTTVREKQVAHIVEGNLEGGHPRR